MRRNLTISFDDQFIPTLDEARGGMSRGKWLEEVVGPSLEVMKDAGIKSAPTPEAERSPEPQDEIERLRGLVAEADPSLTEGFEIRAGGELISPERKPLTKPPLQRPIVQKKR